jgi:hypothetical protein
MVLSLNCLISGKTPNDIFNVPIGEFFTNNQDITIQIIDMTVANLKEQLLRTYEINKAKITKMYIWKAEIEIELDSLEDNKIYTEKDIKGISTTMKPGYNLNEYFDNDKKMPKKNHLHIFIIPASTGKCTLIFYLSNKKFAVTKYRVWSDLFFFLFTRVTFVISFLFLYNQHKKL